jgi:hypothetical protein
MISALRPPLGPADLSRYFQTFMEPRNQFQGMNSASPCSLAGQYDNPILNRFLAPIDCLKIPALTMLWANPSMQIHTHFASISS